MKKDIWYKSRRLGAGLICIALAAAPYIPETAPFMAYMPAIQAGLGACGALLAGSSKLNEGKQ